MLEIVLGAYIDTRLEAMAEGLNDKESYKRGFESLINRCYPVAERYIPWAIVRRFRFVIEAVTLLLLRECFKMALALSLRLFFVRHFYYKRFTVTLRLFLLFAILFIVAIFISFLRFNDFESLLQMQLSDVPFQLWFGMIGGYFTYIIRDSVIISYFSENEFWYGSGLLSFFNAFIPRALYPDKPVVDNGIYVIAMSTGQQVTPPMVPGDLPHYGWPEGYMSGYMEAGWIGLVLGVILSCYLVNFIFSRLVKSDFKIEWIFLYCFFVFRQPLYLSSIDAFNMVFHSIFVLGIGFLIRKTFVISKN